MGPEEFARNKRATTLGPKDNNVFSATNSTLGAIGAMVGWAVGRYSGASFLIPFIATVIVLLIAKKWLDVGRKPILMAFSVQAGYLAWLLLGAIVTRGFGGAFIDIAWLTAGLVWLLSKPGAGPLYFLVAYQVLMLLVNVAAFFHATFGSLAHRALLVHIIWRVMALIFMATLYRQWRSSVSASE